MKQNIITIFFCILVGSTLGHEYKRAHQLTEGIRHNGKHHGQVSQFRASIAEKCFYMCPTPPIPGSEVEHPLKIIFMMEIDALAIYNSTAEVAFVFVGSTSALLLNGKTGVTIWMDINTETFFYFKAGSNDNLWDHSKVPLEDYLYDLGSLYDIKNWKNAQISKFNSATRKVLDELASLIEPLNSSITKRAKSNPQAIVSILVALIKSMSKCEDVVHLIATSLRSTVVITSIQGRIVAFFNGLKDLNQRLPGGLKSLLTANVEISLLFATSSGLETFITLLEQIEDELDFSKVLGEIGRDSEEFLRVAVEIDGGTYSGIQGIVAVIYNIQLYVAKKINLEALIDVLIQVGAQNSVKITKERWDNVISSITKVLEVQTKRFNNQEALSSLSKFFNDIKDNKLVIGGIDVSAIINVLIASSGQPGLIAVLKVLLKLKAVVSITTIVATLYLRLLWFVISGQGIVFLKDIIPGLQITIDFSSTTSVIKQILTSVDVSKIWKYIITLDLIGAITHLPVIGAIYNSVETALKTTDEAVGVSLQSALKASGSIISIIRNWVWFGLGLNGGKQPSGGGIAGLSIIGGGASVSWSAEWVSTVTWSSSGGGILSTSNDGTENANGSSSTSGNLGGTTSSYLSLDPTRSREQGGWTWTWGSNQGGSSSIDGGTSGIGKGSSSFDGTNLASGGKASWGLGGSSRRDGSWRGGGKR